MEYEIKINPCKACSIKYEKEGCNINSMNNCIYETTAAFSGYPSLNVISSEGNKANEECIADIRDKMGPFKGWYKNRKLSKPPIFVQDPHYVPHLIGKGYNVDIAKNMCIKMCNSQGCIDNCITDANAIDSIIEYRENFDSKSLHYEKPIELNTSYAESLKLSKPYYYTGIPPRGTLSDIKLLHYAIPSLNTDIRFSNILKQFSLSEHPRLADIDTRTIPDNFNWINTYKNDNDDIKNKKKLITKPGNQGLCGSCWAISTAGVISDVFVVSNLVSWSPQISTTWALACYPQDKCEGGNPAILLKDISKSGIASDHCIDYSWCLSSDLCTNKDPSNHFEVDTSKLNDLIPSCGCYTDDDHYLYFIKNDSQTIYLNSKETNNVEEFRNIIKKSLLINGPIVGGFVVFNNFMTGTFTKINGGVYLENAIYDDPNKISFSNDQTDSSNYIGSHAIAIIGWGIEKNIIIDNDGNTANVPYWYCRNSWTEKWGENGCFKMAMYPYNKTSQFDKLIKFKTDYSVEEGGGMIIVKATDKPQLKTLQQINDIYIKNIKKVTSESKEQFTQNNYLKKTINNNNNLFYLILILILFLIFIMFFIFYKRK